MCVAALLRVHRQNESCHSLKSQRLLRHPDFNKRVSQTSNSFALRFVSPIKCTYGNTGTPFLNSWYGDKLTIQGYTGKQCQDFRRDRREA